MIKEDYLRKKLNKWLMTRKNIRNKMKKKFKNVEARNALESYLYNTKSALTDEIRGKMSEEEVETVDSTIKNSLEWLDTHQGEDHTVYNEKQTEVEGIIKPIITKLYENANAEMPTQQPDAAGGFESSEATVEEVD